MSLAWKMAGASSKCQERCPSADRGLDTSLLPLPSRQQQIKDLLSVMELQATTHTVLMSAGPEPR